MANNQAKAALALDALDTHAAEYGQKIPKRLRRFYEDGEAFDCDRMCLPAESELPGFGPGSFRLALVIPSWDRTACDDAIVGADGEWAHAGAYVPLFRADKNAYVVACLDSDGCSVGFFDEGELSEDDDDDDYHKGVFKLASSLDAFIEMLDDLDEVDYDIDEDEEDEEEDEEDSDDGDGFIDPDDSDDDDFDLDEED